MTDTRGRDLAARIGLAPIGSQRIEMLLARMVGVFGVLFAATSLPRLVEDWNEVHPAVGLMLAVAVYGSICVAVLAALVHQWTRAVFGAVGVIYLAALALWPLASDGMYGGDGAPWIVAVVGVPCALVVVAARWQVSVAYVLVVAGVIGLLRTMPAGGGVDISAAVLDASDATDVGLALLIVMTAVRRAAREVDSAQGAALSRYADAQIDEATESERVRTDALVHDSVLTTFLSAAGARTPEAHVLASRLAVHTMGVLSRATVASHVGPKVPVAELPARARTDSAGIGDLFSFSIRGARDNFVPEPVADALVSAAVQAMTNSVKHAGGPEVRRSFTIEGTEDGGVRILVEDAGCGFDPAAVASERLGLRVSIIERMRRVGGDVELRTAVGEGTTFVLSWPAAIVPASSPAKIDGRAVLA